MFRTPTLTSSLGFGLLMLLGSRPVLAQTAATYQLVPSAGTFTPLAGGTSVPAVLADDAVSGSLPIGFSFGFGGVSYTSFQASSNGLLGLGGSLTNAGSNLGNTLTSSQLAGASLPALAPFWTDLGGYSGTGATAQYATTGTAPNRVLIMEWLDYKDLNGDADHYISFQVRLYETSNRIEYVYRKGLPGEAGDATIGLKAADGSYLSLTNAGAAPGTSGTTSANRLNRPTTGQVYAFVLGTAPLAAAAPAAAPGLEVYPNPTHDAARITLPPLAAATATQACLLNALGQVVRSQPLRPAATDASFSLAVSGLPAGIYTLLVRGDGPALRQRVVVQ